MLTFGHKTYGANTIAIRGGMNDIIIGKYCSIATGVVMDGGFNHNTSYITKYPFKNMDGIGNESVTCKGNIVIGSDVWIGEGSMVMSGVNIGHGAIIAARSIVTKNVMPYEVVGGSPATHIKFLFTQYQIDKLLDISWWDWDEKKILDNVDLLTSNNIDEFINKHR